MARNVAVALAAVAAAAVVVGVLEFAPAFLADWPPRFARPFPDTTFVDRRGETLRAADLAGKVVLVHAVDMASPESNALAGGDALGGVGGVRPEVGVRSLAFALARDGGARLDDPGLALLHVLLYDLEGGAPDADDAALWAEHFRLDRAPNVHVVAPRRDLRGRASAAAVPGVWLVDKDGFVRYAAAGPAPRHDLARELLPAVPVLLAR